MQRLLCLSSILLVSLLLNCQDGGPSTKESLGLVETIYRTPLATEETVLEYREGDQILARLTMPPGLLQAETRVRMWLDTPDPEVERVFGGEKTPSFSVEFIDRFGKVASVFGEATLAIRPRDRLGLDELQREWTALYEPSPGSGYPRRMFTAAEGRALERMVVTPIFSSTRVTLGRLNATALQDSPAIAKGLGLTPYVRLTATDTSGSDQLPRCLASVYSTIQPANGDIEVDLNKAIKLVFTEVMDESSFAQSFKVLNASSGAEITGTQSYDTSTKTLTFTPTSQYPENTQIEVKISEGLKLASGTAVSSGRLARFRTLLRSRLYAQWRFDGDGTDSSGNGRHIVGSNVSYDTSDKVQGTSSASFNGVTSYFDLSTFNFGTKFTVTVWVNVASPVKGSLNTILSNGNGGIPQNGFKFFINEFATSNLTVVTEAGNGTRGVLVKTTDNFVSVGTWKHLAFVLDKTAAPANRVAFYFNGTKATQGGVIPSPGTDTEFPNDFGTNQQTYIGRFPDFFGSAGNMNFLFKGRMDDFRVYNDVLSDVDIAQVASQR